MWNRNDMILYMHGRKNLPKNLALDSLLNPGIYIWDAKDLLIASRKMRPWDYANTISHIHQVVHVWSNSVGHISQIRSLIHWHDGWYLYSYDHDDVIKRKYFPRYWPLVRRIHRWPVNSPQKGQWSWALMLSFICAWINGWVNNGDAGDLSRHRAHYDVTVLWGLKVALIDMTGYLSVDK